jgi:hypothetical protein
MGQMLTRPTAQNYSALRLRAYVQQRGVRTPNAWTPAEIDAARRLYPDYAAIVAAIPTRSREAIRTWIKRHITQARRPPLRPWTRAEMRQLRDLIGAGSTYREAGQVLGRSAKATRTKCNEAGIDLTTLRYWQPPNPTGVAWYDDLRARMRDLGIGRTALARMIGRRRGSFSPRALRRGQLTRPMLAKIAEALEGTVTFAQDGTPTFAWDDDE